MLGYTKDLLREEHKPEEHHPRDRFGNQLFVSKDFVYLGSNGEKLDAGILISNDGQKFIAEHPKILHDIDRGLVSFEAKDANIQGGMISLGEGRSLQATICGDQSNLYVLKVGERKYAIKTHVASGPGKEDRRQPYINEMLQTQAMALDLKKDLSVLRVEMAHFYFSSGQVSCTSFEEGEGDRSIFTEEFFTRLFSLASNYLNRKQQENDPVWDNIHIDNIGNIQTIARNFKVRKDGTIVWIDPFFYKP